MTVADSMRLDRMLSNLGLGSRNAIREMIRHGAVTVNGNTVRDIAMHIVPETDEVRCQGRLLSYSRQRYVMLNKPGNVLTAARDNKSRTVMDLLPPLYRSMHCTPAGRLDKDTEGLLIITSDGDLVHRIITPGKDVSKIYEVRTDGCLSEEDGTAFASGMTIRDSDGEFTARGAELRIIAASPAGSHALIRITEGKYHQVKRMFAARGQNVVFLKRICEGALLLDASLAPGAWREMSREEAAKAANPAGIGMDDAAALIEGEHHG